MVLNAAREAQPANGIAWVLLAGVYSQQGPHRRDAERNAIHEARRLSIAAKDDGQPAS